MNSKDALMYKVKDNSNSKIAERLAEEWNYNSKKGKIALGILYQKNKACLSDKWSQLSKLKKKKVSWKGK